MSHTFHIGERVRLRHTGELLTVAKFAGGSDRPRIVCEDDDPDSDWRICAPADLEPVTDESADAVAAQAFCPNCGGRNGHHLLVHIRHGNGGGHNERCPKGLRSVSMPEVPAQVTAVAALHQLAKDLDADRRTDYADRVRSVIARLGFETIAVDELLAEAAVLAAYAPGVKVDARATGDRLLSVVGE